MGGWPSWVLVWRASPGGWPNLPAQDLECGCPTLRAFLCGRVGSGHEHDTHLFSPPRGPLRFYLDNPFRPRRIVNKTTPFPVLRPLHQSSLYRIAISAQKPHPPAKSAGRGGATPNLGFDGKVRLEWARSLYFSPMRFFPSIMTLRNIRLIRVW
jgi:hypothetical protein